MCAAADKNVAAAPAGSDNDYGNVHQRRGLCGGRDSEAITASKSQIQSVQAQVAFRNAVYFSASQAEHTTTTAASGSSPSFAPLAISNPATTQQEQQPTASSRGNPDNRPERADNKGGGVEYSSNAVASAGEEARSSAKSSRYADVDSEGGPSPKLPPPPGTLPTLVVLASERPRIAPVSATIGAKRKSAAGDSSASSAMVDSCKRYLRVMRFAPPTKPTPTPQQLSVVTAAGFAVDYASGAVVPGSAIATSTASVADSSASTGSVAGSSVAGGSGGHDDVVDAAATTVDYSWQPRMNGQQKEQQRDGDNGEGNGRNNHSATAEEEAEAGVAAVENSKAVVAAPASWMIASYNPNDGSEARVVLTDEIVAKVVGNAVSGGRPVSSARLAEEVISIANGAAQAVPVSAGGIRRDQKPQQRRLALRKGVRVPILDRNGLPMGSVVSVVEVRLE